MSGSAPTSTNSRWSSRPTARSSPAAALREASEILIKSLAIFTDAERVEELTAREPVAPLPADALSGAGDGDGGASSNGLDEILIEELELGVRSYNCLKRAGVQTVGDLVRKSRSELNAIPNFGSEVDRGSDRDPALPRPRPPAGLSDAARAERDPMRHRKKRNKLSRNAAHRESLLSNLSKQLIEHERIKTSQAKAKAVKPEVEQLITLAKRGDLHARRQALATLHNDKFIVHKLFEEVAPRYAERPGGYTRIVKLGPRQVGLDRDGLPRAGLGSGEGLAGQVDLAAEYPP